jgi:hypothetical protein
LSGRLDRQYSKRFHRNHQGRKAPPIDGIGASVAVAAGTGLVTVKRLLMYILDNAPLW